MSDVANPSERTKTGLLTVLYTKMSNLEARTNMHGDFELQTKQRKQNETKIKRFRRDTSQGRVVRSSVSAEPGSTSWQSKGVLFHKAGISAKAASSNSALGSVSRTSRNFSGDINPFISSLRTCFKL